jgi:hypothetical protein
MTCTRGCCTSQADHFRSIQTSPRMLEVGRGHQADTALEYDRAAYRAMKKQGLQPPQLRGAYDLARKATSEAEIQLGRVIAEKDPARKRRGTRLMENMLEIASTGMTGTMPDVDAGTKVPMRPKKRKKT